MSILVAGGCAAAGSSGGVGHGEEAHRPDTHGDAQGHADMHGAAHSDHEHHLPATAGPGFTVADVEFMQMMIGHHAQALEMAVMAPDRSEDPDIRFLARKIDISQRDEILLMTRWLEERDQAVPEEDAMLTMQMPGMVTPEQFSRLEAARGPEFDRLFLTFMIEHHVGALEMVDALFASPGAAQDPDIFRFATDVGSDQLDEIGVMESMLAAMDGDPLPRSDHR